MAASLSDIVQINITSATAQLKQAGFGVPLILDYHTRWSERIRFYTSIDGLTSDGFLTTDAAYLAAAAVFAQNPQVSKLAIGRRVTVPDHRAIITLSNVTSSKVYAIQVNGLTASYTSDSTATAAEITAGVTSAINALAISGLTVTEVSGVSVTLNHTTPGTYYRVKVLDMSALKVVWKQSATDADAGVASDLAAIALENNGFYGIDVTSMSRLEQAAVASWALSNKKLAIMTCADGDMPTSSTSDIASVLKATVNTRASCWFHTDNGSFIGSAVMGRCLPLNPGAVTFANKTLSGVESLDLNPTQLTNLAGKYANWFTEYGGVSITRNGKLAANEWIDIIRDRDWLENRLQTRVASVLINNNKVAYTDAGIALIAAEVRAQLAEAVTAGMLADDPAFLVTVPKASAVASIDRAARLLKDINFSARYAGAIHNVTINGTISV